MGGGRTLAEVIAADGPLAPREAARIGAQVLDALARGHRSGLVHGAVEPDRVVLERGRAQLAAFGAEPFDASPGYRAPERAAGRPPGPEADLWSLGATLHTAVEGRAPEAGQPAEAPRAGPLAPVIASLLRTDPAQRPGAEWTGHMLERVAAGFTVGPATAAALPVREPATATAPAPPPPTPGPGPGRGPQPAGGRAAAVRRPGVVITAVVLALALIGGLVFLLAGRGTHHRAAVTAPATPPSATAPATPGTSGTPGTQSPTAPSPATPTPATPSPSPSPATPAPTPTSPPQTPSPAVPSGYVRTDDPAGFSFALPTGWTRTDNGMGAGDYSPDNGGHVLRFTVIANPSGQAPVDGFRQIEQSLTQQGGYTRIDLRTNTFQGNPGAYWEFTFGSSHVGAQSLLAPNGNEYTVYLSTPDADWASYQPVLTTALDTLTIP
ncbi:hypothetical protein ACFV1W_33020 [Kitasatospora sp. NPDC059648]|uniref:protein kinase domain-containing protein n=1 Tax=Kitasatospora sp. NPDC059648 TaxID=3346894 RepID=UPI0036CED45C